ncbi:MAG: hypothetical protein A2Y57_04035 [Candidatus Woykebacteria bacterium RBG_13_40_7b]|uniref:DNA polymerase III subunit delta n=1 Tax=Candidatus Woykebacteria bacterium RBG_13_40_7b TaxID=1802594 RepID=A0A1G1W7L4_9BACT|nr:MAG: hypothetical protein A2Y57_04035 [Candidatus Woykebacteria bacterium RBG_13_40_7b]
MSRSFVIVGATADERKEFVLKEIDKYSSQFDRLIIDSYAGAGINEVRELQRQVSRLPLNSNFTSAVILEAQNLSLEAQNALLKTLEEPPSKTRLYLTSKTVDSLLPTISSRCTIINLRSDRTDDETKLKNTQDLFRKILKSSLGERFILTKELNFGSLEILLEIALHEQADFLSLRKSQIAEILENLKKTQKLLESNVNKKLAYEVFLLNLPTISSS